MTSKFALCGNRTGRCPVRAVASFEADWVKAGVVAEGSKISAEASSAAAPPLEAEELLPPMTTTRPLRGVVAVMPERAVIRVGPAETVAGAGSKISGEAQVCVAPASPT